MSIIKWIFATLISSMIITFMFAVYKANELRIDLHELDSESLYTMAIQATLLAIAISAFQIFAFWLKKRDDEKEAKRPND